MKVEYEFYGKNKAFEIFPRIGIRWGWDCSLSIYSIEFEWLKWGVEVDLCGDGDGSRSSSEITTNREE